MEGGESEGERVNEKYVWRSSAVALSTDSAVICDPTVFR